MGCRRCASGGAEGGTWPSTSSGWASGASTRRSRGRATERIQEECDTATRHLHETTLELQAINAVAAAATPSLDVDRQIEISLRKTLEVTRFKVGAIFLVEEAQGTQVLRFARGVGDPAYLNLAPARAHLRGEGVAGAGA